MNTHGLRSFVLVGALLGLPCLVLAQPRDGAGPPRTPWGIPDLQGTWSLPTMTPLERPAGYEDRPRLTGAEAEEFLATRRSRIRQALAAALSADFELGDGGVTESIYEARCSTGVRRWSSHRRTDRSPAPRSAKIEQGSRHGG